MGAICKESISTLSKTAVCQRFKIGSLKLASIWTGVLRPPIGINTFLSKRPLAWGCNKMRGLFQLF